MEFLLPLCFLCRLTGWWYMCWPHVVQKNQNSPALLSANLMAMILTWTPGCIRVKAFDQCFLLFSTGVRSELGNHIESTDWMRQRVSREQDGHLCAWGLATQDGMLEVLVTVDSTETRRLEDFALEFEKQRKGHQKPQADTGICFRSIFLEAQLATDFSGGRFLSSRITSSLCIR